MNRFCKTAFLILGLALAGAAAGRALAQSPDPFADDALTWRRDEEIPEQIFFGSIDLGSGAGSPAEVDYGCKEGLGELPFLRRLASLTDAIRGVQRWPCHGTRTFASARYYGFDLLKAGFAPSLFPAGGRGRGGAHRESGRKAQVFRDVNVRRKLLQFSIAQGVPFRVRQSPAPAQ